MVQHGYCPRGPFCAFAHVESKYYNSSALVLILLYLEIKYLRNVRTSLDLILQWSGRTEQLHQQLSRDIVKSIFKLVWK